jgi:hypothetical protein
MDAQNLVALARIVKCASHAPTSREDTIDEMCGGLGHPPGVARGADAAPLAGEGHQEIAAVRRAPCPGEAVSQDAALQVASQLALSVAGYRAPIAVAFAPRRQVGLQALPDEAVEDGLLGVATCLDSGAASRALGGHVRVGLRRVSGE